MTTYVIRARAVRGKGPRSKAAKKRKALATFRPGKPRVRTGWDVVL